MAVPRDFFGKGKGPSPANEELEKEAAREIERLTGGGPRPAAFGPGMGAGMGPGGPSFGGSPLEQIAAQMAQRKSPGRRRRGQPPTEDRAGFKGGGFLGAAAMTGSVGSALGYGGGVAPGGRPKPPPADALPLGHRPPEEYGRGPGVAEDDDSDDDIGVTEMALRDHAERFGRGMEDTMIRSDPAAAETMREQALRQFMDRQAGQPRPTVARPPSGRLNLRTRRPGGGGLRFPPPDEAADADPDAHAPPDEDDAIEAAEAGGTPDAIGAEAPDGPDAGTRRPMIEVSDDDLVRLAEERALVAEDRARVAENRARVAEERARLGEERATYAEARAWSAAKQASEAIERLAAVEAFLGELVKEKEQKAVAKRSKPPAAAKKAVAKTAVKKAVAKKMTPAKAPAAAKAPTKEADTAKAPAKATAPVTKKVRVKKVAAASRPAPVPAPPSTAPAPRVGGMLGRRLAEQAGGAAAPVPPAPAPASPSPPGPARIVRKAPGAIKRRPPRS